MGGASTKGDGTAKGKGGGPEKRRVNQHLGLRGRYSPILGKRDWEGGEKKMGGDPAGREEEGGAPSKGKKIPI